MSMSNYARDKYVAQEFSKLTECNAASIQPDFPDSATWLSSFVVTSIFIRTFPPKKAALAFALIRRAEAAITDYEDARSELNSLTTTEKTVSGYFRCLRRFESAVAATYQALDFGRRATGESLFLKGDGSDVERLNRIYNTSKHADPEKLPDGHLHSVWLTNEGLNADGVQLKFSELRGHISSISRIADTLSKGQAPAES